jgi:hypothetical protein
VALVPKIPRLLQYVSNGNYYARFKLKRKIIRARLKTTVWSTAKLRLVDFIKDQREQSSKIAPPMFTEAVEAFKRELDSDPGIKPQNKKARSQQANLLRAIPL